MALRLTDELFVVPYEGEYLIYAPLIGSVVKVTALIVKDLQMLDVTGEVQPKSVRESLLQAKIVINTEEKIKESDQKSYKSTK